MKSFGFLVSFIIVIYLWIAFVVVNCELTHHNENAQAPELEAKWEEAGRDGWFYEGEDSHAGVTFEADSIVVNSWVKRLLITCSAHYPIYWEYGIPKDFTYSEYSGAESIRISTYRTSEEFNDPSTYIFYSILHISRFSSSAADMGRLVTGNYTCKSAGASTNAKNESLSVNRFIFWEGASRHLIYGELAQTEQGCTKPSCRGRPSRTVTADKDNHTIVLPCAVSNPRIQVELFKKSSEEFQKVTLPDNFIKFDAKIGYILKVQELPSPYGIYKCFVKPVSFGYGEILIVNATSEIPKDLVPYKENLTTKAKFYFNPNGRTINCCAVGTKPPKIYKKTCESKFECVKIRKELENFEHFDRSDDRKVNCRSALLPFDHNSGVFRCFGDGIDVIREYYLPKVQDMTSLEPMLDRPNIYYDDDIGKLTKDEHYITFSSNNGHVDDSMFSGFSMLSTSLQCHTSTYLFTRGIRWTVVWRNGTREFKWITPAYPPSNAGNLEDNFNSLELDPHSDMTQVICHAPIFNSWEWVNKTLTLNITESTPPCIESLEEEVEITWILNHRNVELICDIHGFPNPTFEWTDPWTTHEYTYRYEDYSWGSIIRNHRIEYNYIKFSKVMKEMEGTYTCTGTNFRGSAVKTFQVIVLDESPLTTIQPYILSSEEEHEHEHEHEHHEHEHHEQEHEHETHLNSTPINYDDGWSEVLHALEHETTPEPEIPSVSEDQQPTEEDLVKPNEPSSHTIHSDENIVEKSATMAHSESTTLEPSSSSTSSVTFLVIALVVLSFMCVGLSTGLVFVWLKARKLRKAFNESLNQGTMLNWNEMVGGSRTTVDEDI